MAETSQKNDTENVNSELHPEQSCSNCSHSTKECVTRYIYLPYPYNQQGKPGIMVTRVPPTKEAAALKLFLYHLFGFLRLPVKRLHEGDQETHDSKSKFARSVSMPDTQNYEHPPSKMIDTSSVKPKSDIPFPNNCSSATLSKFQTLETTDEVDQRIIEQETTPPNVALDSAPATDDATDDTQDKCQSQCSDNEANPTIQHVKPAERKPSPENDTMCLDNEEKNTEIGPKIIQYLDKNDDNDGNNDGSGLLVQPDGNNNGSGLLVQPDGNNNGSGLLVQPDGNRRESAGNRNNDLSVMQSNLPSKLNENSDEVETACYKESNTENNKTIVSSSESVQQNNQAGSSVTDDLQSSTASVSTTISGSEKSDLISLTMHDDSLVYFDETDVVVNTEVVIDDSAPHSAEVNASSFE